MQREASTRSIIEVTFSGEKKKRFASINRLTFSSESESNVLLAFGANGMNVDTINQNISRTAPHRTGRRG
jgi:hypothetical protein